MRVSIGIDLGSSRVKLLALDELGDRRLMNRTPREHDGLAVEIAQRADAAGGRGKAGERKDDLGRGAVVAQVAGFRLRPAAFQSV